MKLSLGSEWGYVRAFVSCRTRVRGLRELAAGTLSIGSSVLL